MEQLQFEDYEELACEIADKFDSINDEFGDISIIAKYDEAKEIIKELLCLEYNVASVELHREEFGNYYDEYIVSLNFDGVWCEKFKRVNGYFDDESNVIYIMDNCSSVIIPYCKSKNLYEVSVGDTNGSEDDEEESETEHTYTVNGKTVDKKTFDKYVSKFKETENNDNEDSGYSVTIKVGLDTEEAENIIRDMEKNVNRHVSDMFDMLYRPYPYEYRPHPIRLFW